MLYLARIERSCPRSHFRALYIYGWFAVPWTLGLSLFILLNLSFERLALIRGKSPVYYVHFIYKVLMCLPDSGCESHIWRWVSAHQTERLITGSDYYVGSKSILSFWIILPWSDIYSSRNSWSDPRWKGRCYVQFCRFLSTRIYGWELKLKH